jgi:hypothetical protein
MDSSYAEVEQERGTLHEKCLIVPQEDLSVTAPQEKPHMSQSS